MKKSLAKMRVPVSEPNLGIEEMRNVMDVMKSGWISSKGAYIEKFEKLFAKFVGAKYALSTFNGTVALHLALEALGIGPGDEVIVPDFTFVATANAVSYTGAKPVFVDVERDTWCLDPKKLQAAITKKTKAIIPVHIYGHPADMGPIKDIAAQYNLYVVEDAAEAHGAKYKGRRVGPIGHIGIFSFFANKVMTTGEGGMLVTDDEKLYKKAKSLRNHGMHEDRKYWHTSLGFNYRMINLQAAIGLAQLKKLDKLIAQKRKIFSWYKEYLKGVKHISLNTERNHAFNVYWMVCVLFGKEIGTPRDEIIDKLAARGVESRPFFYPLSMMPAHSRKERTEVTYDISARGINLPSGTTLTKPQVKYVCDCLKDILNSSSAVPARRRKK